ncbi:hypothetical protein GIB67_005941 [Kingdonia uniflora]|uniref:Uncharacterized protein n=1 Tax=Kingdonia uniflora TaxID=39325 RepID=A0A7J7MBM6_9MAGN|nr:hypothetical protein GIB67_005941 [Kingdonia uniflora]
MTTTGKYKSVALWSIEDYITASAIESGSKSIASAKQTSKTEKSEDSITVGPPGIYHGHDDTVEDIRFCPSR